MKLFSTAGANVGSINLSSVQTITSTVMPIDVGKLYTNNKSQIFI